MAKWQVVADRIVLYPHTNADALLLGRVGPFQVVVGKSNGYEEGDIVFFAPERSVLPEDLRSHYVNSETGISYLAGPEHDRVQRVRLRGEYSDGVTIDRAWALRKLGVSSIEEVPLDTDLSEALGISKYEPPIPTHMAGNVTPITVAQWHQHDVEPLGIYRDELQDGELVVITEKIHGSQIVVYAGANGTEIVTSKGLSAKGLALQPSETNVYWRAVYNEVLFERLCNIFPGRDVQAFGEVIPVQKGFNYGASVPSLRLFRLVVDGHELAHREIPDGLLDLWVPILFRGPYHPDIVATYAKGSEVVSGKSLHIREGVVVTPMEPRAASRGFALYLKAINPKFKDSEEFVS